MSARSRRLRFPNDAACRRRRRAGAGLACAVELSRTGVAVEVFESAAVLGGRARLVEKDGWQVDNGQHMRSEPIQRHCACCACSKSARSGCGPLSFFLHIPGKLELRAPALPAPLHLAMALFHAKGLAWSDCFAAARLLRTLGAVIFRLGDDYSVTTLLHRTRQTRAPDSSGLGTSVPGGPQHSDPARFSPSLCERAARQRCGQLLRVRIPAPARRPDRAFPVPAMFYLMRRNRGSVRSTRARAGIRTRETARSQRRANALIIRVSVARAVPLAIVTL